MIATVVIVGYRAYPELRRCLSSLARHEPGLPVVVIDHAADPEQAAALAAEFPHVVYRPLEVNPGFGAGVNRGVREAGPGPLLLLNPDCELTMPLAASLLAVLDAHPQAGIVGGLVREADGSVQASARRFPDATTGVAGRTSWLSRVLPGNPLTRRNLTTEPGQGTRQVDWVSGALMLIRRETFDRIGGFDERFFLYWEDADFCKRAAAAGWSTWYAPASEVVHGTARTSRHAPVASLAAFHVSAFRYYWKHGSVAARLASPIAATGLALRFAIRLVSRRPLGSWIRQNADMRVLILLLAGAACAAAPGGSVSPLAVTAVTASAADEPVRLGVGESATVAGQRARVTFIGVSDDSRCPIGVTCVWEGDALVRVRVESEGESAVDLELHANSRFGQAGTAGTLTVTLLELQPAPRADQAIPPNAYSATVQISSK